MSRRISQFAGALLSRMRQLLGNKKCAVGSRTGKGPRESPVVHGVARSSRKKQSGTVAGFRRWLYGQLYVVRHLASLTAGGAGRYGCGAEPGARVLGYDTPELRLRELLATIKELPEIHRAPRRSPRGRSSVVANLRWRRRRQLDCICRLMLDAANNAGGYVCQAGSLMRQRAGRLTRRMANLGARRRVGKLPSTAREVPSFIIGFSRGNRPDKWIVVKERLLGQFNKALILELVDRARLWGLDAWSWMRQDARTGVDVARHRLNALSSNVNDWRTGKLQLEWRVLVTRPVVIATVAGFVLVCGNLLLTQNGPNYQLASGHLPTGDALHLSTAQLLDGVPYINNPDTQKPVLLNGQPPQRNVPISEDPKPQPLLAPEGVPHTVAYVGGVSRGSGSGDVSWPARGSITSPFGWRFIFGERNFHTGIDIGAGYGTPVDAATSGMVVLAGWDGGYGRCILIDHGNGLATRYAHLSRIDVGLGELVNAGEIIGNVGESGNATGPHLHFEVIINGNVENPLRFLQ